MKKYIEYLTEATTVKFLKPKEKLTKAWKKIPNKWKKSSENYPDVTVKVVKSDRGDAYYNPFDKTIYIDDRLTRLNKFSYESEKKWLASLTKSKSKINPDKIDRQMEWHNDYGLEKKHIEYSLEHLTHVIAHEMGHHVHRQINGIFNTPKIKQKVRTITVAKYQDYVDDRIADEESRYGRVLPNTGSKVDSEKYAEMFRLFVMEGKYKSFFDKEWEKFKRATKKKKK